MTTENIVNKLDREAKALKVQIELGNALDKLRSNRDFNKLITEGYLKDEAVKLVHEKAKYNNQGVEDQAEILRCIDAIGVLANYFDRVERDADIASRQLHDLEEARTDLLKGGE